ncbi:hypothetical protein [Brachybacterium sp. UMB0905]|uniref:hypothetical protein n=1 Tax=Brachybacterium sp. UMB0905 TaxID=2069310 RepID=UPI000C802A71|nr:hypothetical protein [Brachybacterium sp. UMB0905]PMC76370.1 hypothetical protein CJ197_04235 [Brachybacterium sp. UMB0905]
MTTTEPRQVLWPLDFPINGDARAITDGPMGAVAVDLDVHNTIPPGAYSWRLTPAEARALHEALGEALDQI